MINSIKTIKRFQINGIKHIQLSAFFNVSAKHLTTLNHSLLANTWYYLNKDGKVKTIQIPEIEYSISCQLREKEVFMSVVEVGNKLILVF